MYDGSGFPQEMVKADSDSCSTVDQGTRAKNEKASINMCGICGFISYKPESMDGLVKMNNTLAHRGPDDHGEKIYQIAGGKYVGFAQRRLSIMDMFYKGHQPMHSLNKRISVIFNGEIYNYRERRGEIKDYEFISDCDTEVLIVA